MGSVCYSQDLFDTMAKETCGCIESKKLALGELSNEQIQAEFVTCFFATYSAHAEEINAMENISLGNEAQMEKFGEKVAMKMINHCPSFLLALGQADQSDGTPAQSLKIEGEIIDIKTEQFVTIQVKDKSGRMHNFMLMNYFESASLFTNSELKKKDKIAVRFTEVELYDPKAKEFRYFKIINGLEKK